MRYATIARQAGLIGVLLVALAPPADAQGGQPLTHEVLWSFKRVGAPLPSPDGRWVVFPVQEPSYDPEQEVTDLWIVPADGSAEPRRLTASRRGEAAPAWSPDSTRLAFSARRGDDEVNQIYVLDVARGGEAQRVTDAPTAAGAPRWSPDGTRIVFQAAMWSGAIDEESNRRAAQQQKNAKSKVRTYDSFPVRNWDRWLEDTKTHLWIVEAQGDRRSRSLLAGTRLAGLRGFGRDALHAAWAPDGGSILFVATDHLDTAARSNVIMHLYRVPADGGEPSRVTQEAWDFGAPRFSPDGRSVCFTVSDPRPAIYTMNRLGCMSWPAAGAVTVLTREFDRSVGTWAFTPDSQTIYLTAEDRHHERIYSVPAGGGEVALAVDAPQGVYTSLQIPERAQAPALFANWESAVHPAEIVRIEPVSKQRTFLSSFNVERAASLDWQPLREFSFIGRGGRPIHSQMALPPGFDETKKYPLFVLIHGGHATMWRDAITYRWNYHLLAQPNFVVLMTDYRGSTGYGERFTLDIQGDPLAGPADDLNDAADEAIRRFPFIDGTRQAAGGASYGGHLANWLAVTTDRYRTLVSHAGLASLDMQWGTSDFIHHRELMMDVPYWEDPQRWIAQSPLARAGNLRTPMLLSIGVNDYRVPEGNTLAMFAALQRMSVPSRLLVWPDEHHWILKGENSRVFYREVRDWLERHVEAPAPATTAGR